MALTEKTAIDVKNLNIVYNDIKLGLNAIQDLSFTVKQGEFLSIVGPSGCGKSTILKVLSDTLNKETTDFTGTVLINNESPDIARTKRKVGLVFQKPTLLEWRSVESNILLPLEIMKTPKPEAKEIVKNLLRLTDLEKYSKFHPSQLSGGMQQRVSIARALAYNPEVLLMDEPFGAIDEINRRKMNDELLEIWQKTQKTVVFITHSIEEAIYLSQRILVLTKQPGTLRKEIKVDLPYPRNKTQDDIKFFKYITEIRKLLED